jgi:hypothetical protein
MTIGDPNANLDLAKEVSPKMPLSLALVLWDIVANKLQQSTLDRSLSEDERRGIWVFQDLLERCLEEEGQIAPSSAFDALLRKALEQIKQMPVKYEDSWPRL